MKDAEGRSVTFEVWVVCRYQKGTRGKKGVEYLVYVVHQIKTSLGYIREDYRKRFGIESSYRLKNLINSGIRQRDSSSNLLGTLLRLAQFQLL